VVLVPAAQQWVGAGLRISTSGRRLFCAYDVGPLGASEQAAAFYATRGWKVWQGPSSALTPTGIKPTSEDDGCIYVFPLAVPLDLGGGLTCDWRAGDVW
jgi:aminoglycoside 2'-N-acetyltransferase I